VLADKHSQPKRALLEIDSHFPHANRQPVVLVEAARRGKWEVETHAYEHPAPVRVIQVEVKLVHPTLLDGMKTACLTIQTFLSSPPPSKASSTKGPESAEGLPICDDIGQPVVSCIKRRF
jgi:hypothetical protein